MKTEKLKQIQELPDDEVGPQRFSIGNAVKGVAELEPVAVREIPDEWNHHHQHSQV